MVLLLVAGGPEHRDLKRAMEQFDALDATAYTPATYRLTGYEYAAATAVFENPDATKADKEAAATRLSEAIQSLRPQNGSASLWQTYADFFELGTIYSGAGDLDSSTTRGKLTLDHFNALTAENYMKPEHLSSNAPGVSGGVFNISPSSDHPSDQLCRQALDAGYPVHGHVLVWHSQSPTWINGGPGGNLTRAQAKANMEHYIQTVVEHFDTRYPGVVKSWDVVNEAFLDGVSAGLGNADWKDHLRPGTQSGWIKAYSNGMAEGEDPSDFIYDAFVFARRYTDAKLFYNDFNLYQDGKSRLVAKMVLELNARYKDEYPEDPRLLIEGVGMQSHNYIQDTPPSSVENGIRNLLASGVDLMITELDLFCFFPWNAQPPIYQDLKDRMTVEDLTGVSGTQAQKDYWIGRGVTNGSQIEVIQAELFAEYFQIYKKYADHIDRVTFWGLSDTASWRRGHNPLLWNSDWTPKDAFYAVSDPEGYLASGQES